MSILNMFSSVYGLVFALSFLLYFLEIRTRYLFRMVSTLQMLSYGIYFQRYLSAETEQLLRTMFKANGGMFQTYRNQAIDNYYTVPTGITAACCLLLFFGGYWLTLSFTKRKYASYGEYLADSVFKLLECFFYFHSKQLFYFSALYIKSVSSSSALATTSPLVNIAVVYMIVVLAYYTVVLIKYQRRTLSVVHFSKTFYLYSMLSPMVVMLVPLTTLTYVVYCCQLGLYVLIMLIGKHRITRKKVVFFVLEGVMILISIVYFVLENTIQIWFGIAVLLLFLGCSLADIVFVFWFEKPENKAEVIPSNLSTLQPEADQEATVADLHQKNVTEMNMGEFTSPEGDH